jgi:hypothetical protein
VPSTIGGHVSGGKGPVCADRDAVNTANDKRLATGASRLGIFMLGVWRLTLKF